MHKKWVMDRIVNDIRFAWKLAYRLRTYRTYNPMVKFSKYKFNNKLLGDVTFLRIVPCVIWT